MAKTGNTICQICLTNCGIEITVDEASNAYSWVTSVGRARRPTGSSSIRRPSPVKLAAVDGLLAAAQV
ncbi:hypothetical protein [Mycolicibacterium holsaticum]|uniref:Uncharacterized protein n=1 Tax=Mycolicibacterium holsaticum TaxID=152142 RepID=A0A1E3RTD5_9MYCO|nr:hypothetical protein [Mycolicibacterium holsaticum]MDA4108714.1 hypothetical protein [Mycolicibacterium holsaticum DSM 44478 = JCM 12374]ODQ93081.1 hypothetical protein BHQ17_14665 [Mycolicibacterium holsaticum]QZA12573.1 hypothetical protein K3U96_26315 [Mycolicibacterium holsaticum DSM 44478 = JCM 12374]UNC09948.1 hypothetical protein H5U41_00485 [Mycolicibacterium holsaticum DSM 44478 = JCM 12374]